MSTRTVAIFRRWKNGGSVIALFPNDPAGVDGEIGSYMHIGQHGAADYDHVIRQTEATTPQEHRALRQELESIGYRLTVRQKRSRK